MKFLTSIIALSFVIPIPVFGQGRLTALVDQFDFGIVPAGSVLTHHFMLRSTGQDTVVITDVKTGCSCAISDLERKVLAPGDSVLLGIQWDTGRSRGSIFRSPRVFYNNSDDYEQLAMSGQIWDDPSTARPVTAKPFRFELSRAAVKDVDKIEFTLTNHSDEDLPIVLLSLPPEQIELTLPASVPANGAATGFVRLNPESRNEEFGASITLLVGDRQNTRLTIPIRRKFY